MAVILQAHDIFDLSEDWQRYLLAEQTDNKRLTGCPLLFTPLPDNSLWLQPGAVENNGSLVRALDSKSILVPDEDLLGLISGGHAGVFTKSSSNNTMDPDNTTYSWVTKERKRTLEIICRVRFEHEPSVDFTFTVQPALREHFVHIIQQLADGQPFPCRSHAREHLTALPTSRDDLASILWSQR